MIIDNFTLLAKFTEYNNWYFSGMLPIPMFNLMHGCQTLGYFSYQYDKYNNANQMIQMIQLFLFNTQFVRLCLIGTMVNEQVRSMAGRRYCSNGRAPQLSMPPTPQCSLSRVRERYGLFSLRSDGWR